ncbi:MAG: YheT family hydrolase [Bacteroidia bacterium]
MPLIVRSDYKAPAWAIGGHMQTILPALFRKLQKPAFKREKTSTADNDFLYTDWLRNGHKKLVILSHGLEGNSYSGYILGMAKMLHDNGFDVLAWNHRMCAGEINIAPRMYHSGNSEDLRNILNHVLHLNIYPEIYLVGFSMGGNITLKYLGEEAENIAAEIKKAVVFSVPVDLGASGKKLAKFSNKIYLNRFLKSLKTKVLQKHKQIPGIFTNIEKLHEVKTFHAFDELFTAPLHGFNSAADYYQKSSSKQFLPQIKIPTLIVNAKNDPFLSQECFPAEEAVNSNYVFLEIPETGGHVGFFENKLNGIYWSEKRALQFIFSKQ